MAGYFLDHMATHLMAPDGLRSVELAQVDLRELLIAMVHQIANHGLREYVAENRPLHNVGVDFSLVSLV